MKKITSIPDLLDALEHFDKKSYIQIAKNIDIPKEDFLEFAQWDSRIYTRNCLVRTKRYELILLCWEEGQSTPIHCHGGEECWVLVLDGTLAEKRYFKAYKTGKLVLDHSMNLTKGMISYMNDDMGFHALANQHGARSMSLHLYMNPIDSCRVFDENKGTFVQKELSYHSNRGLSISPS